MATPLLSPTSRTIARASDTYRLLIAAVLILSALACGRHAAAQQLPPGFSEEIVFSGLSEPTAVAFAPDGRVFVAEKNGLIKAFDSLFATAPTIFADLRARVYNYKKSGLLGLALDPDFPTQPFVYVLYTYDGAVGGTAPVWGDTCPLANADNCAVSARLSRLQANGNVMTGAEQVLVADWYQRYPNQPVGALAFGPEGALYASAGDGAAATFVDVGQGAGPSPDPLNEGGALRSQDLRTPPDPVALSGTVIRVHPDTGQPVPQTPSMLVGAPTVDANGVKSYAVTSVFQGPDPTIVRVLEPTDPAPGEAHRFLYVLPVDSGVTDLNSFHSDGLEELRLLDVHNRYNLTLIAPSFHIQPWYGDHDSMPNRRLESFIVKDLVPFGDSFAPPDQIHQRWLIGFSKSGNGALTLILRNPHVFSAAAAWDAPAQFTDISHFEMAENFGTEQNFDHYEIPSLVLKNAEPFRTHNRIWISGDESAWTSHMIQLDQQMTQAGVLHTWVQGGARDHSWDSGWLEGAVATLDANATTIAPVDSNAQRIIAYGLRNPSHIAFRPGTDELWVADAGWNDWEEINRVGNAADGVVENFGWPCYEGVGSTAYAGFNICGELYSESAVVTPPVYTYHHSQQVVAGETCSAGSGMISGVAFYDTGTYPASYEGALFFSDAARNCIWAMFEGANGVPDPASRITFATGAASPVDLKIGPGGDLFYIDLIGGTVRRIRYDTTAPVRSNGAPTGTLVAGTTQTTLSLTTNENASCRYATAAGVAYGSMPNPFTTTGGTAHSTTVSGLTNGSSYGYFVRCQDAVGNANTNDFAISFSVALPVTTVTAFPTSTTILTGTLNGGNASSLNSDNNVYFAVNSTTSGTRTTSWYGLFTGVSSALSNLRVNYKGNNSASCTQTIAIWNWSTSAWVQLDSRSVSTTEIAINNLIPSGTLANYVSTTGTGELRVRVQCTKTSTFIARGDLMSIVYDVPVGPPPPDTTAPVLSNGAPSGTLVAGTTQTTLSLTTNENATCRYATSAGVAYGSMLNTFTTTGGSAHSSTVSGLTNGGSYAFYVKCQDTVGNANTGDFIIGFSIAFPPPPPPAPTVSLSANPTSVSSGSASTLTWSSTNATSCIASVDWSGAKPTSGSQSTGNLTANSTFTLTCSGSGGSATQSATVSVTAPPPPPSGLIGWWQFDEVSGSTVSDSSGIGNTGTLVNGPVRVPGKIGQALSFDGVDDYVNVPSHPSLNFGQPGDPFTLSVWIKTTKLGGGILAKGRVNVVSFPYLLELDSSGRVFFSRWCQGCPDFGDGIGTSVFVADGNWHHILFVSSGASLHQFYIDGNLETTDTKTWTHDHRNNESLTIGNFHNSTFANDFFSGLIDDVRIFNRALTPAEIEALH